MSAEPSTVSSAVAKKTNASKWPVFKKILGNLDDISRFTETTDRLTVYLRNHRAYYQDARPEIVGVLETAAHAFTQLAQAYTSSPSIDTEVPDAVHLPTLPGGVPCPSRYVVALQAFIGTVRTVHAHIDEFKKSSDDINRGLATRLQPIFSTFIPDYPEAPALQQHNSAAAVETTPPSHLPRTPLSKTPSSLILPEHRRTSMTPSRVTSPSASSLLIPATSSPFPSVMSAIHRHATPRDETPETTGGVFTGSTNDVDALLTATSAHAASPVTTSAVLEPTSDDVVDVEMSETKTSDGPAVVVPPEPSELQATHEIDSSGQSPTRGVTPSEPSDNPSVRDHGGVRHEEARITENTEPTTVVEGDPLFGTEYRVHCFERGRTSASSFTLKADDIPLEPLQLWQAVKSATIPPSSISDSRCLSFVIYDAEDILAQQNTQASASVESWFRSARRIPAGDMNLHRVSATMQGHRLLPAFFKTAQDPFVDLSVWASDGGDLVEVTHTGDASRYIFSLVSHRPTEAQEARAWRSYRKKTGWNGREQ